MNTERDTHFQGFADLLWEEMKQQPLLTFADNPLVYEQHMKTLITQRAYDLVRHAIDSVAGGIYTQSYVGMGEDADIADVPDLTQWPTS